MPTRYRVSSVNNLPPADVHDGVAINNRGQVLGFARTDHAGSRPDVEQGKALCSSHQLPQHGAQRAIPAQITIDADQVLQARNCFGRRGVIEQLGHDYSAVPLVGHALACPAELCSACRSETCVTHSSPFR